MGSGVATRSGSDLAGPADATEDELAAEVVAEVADELAANEEARAAALEDYGTPVGPQWMARSRAQAERIRSATPTTPAEDIFQAGDEVGALEYDVEGSNGGYRHWLGRHVRGVDERHPGNYPVEGVDAWGTPVEIWLPGTFLTRLGDEGAGPGVTFYGQQEPGGGTPRWTWGVGHVSPRLLRLGHLRVLVALEERGYRSAGTEKGYQTDSEIRRATRGPVGDGKGVPVGFTPNDDADEFGWAMPRVWVQGGLVAGELPMLEALIDYHVSRGLIYSDESSLA